MDTFTSRIKNEIITLDLEYKEATALFLGFYECCNFKDNYIRLSHQFLAQYIVELVKKLFEIELETITNGRFIKLNFKDLIPKIEELNLKYLSQSQIIAYLRGVFLASGTTNDPSQLHYHLELSSLSHLIALKIEHLLSKSMIKSKITKRRNRYIVYIKKGEYIADFLNLIGANSCLYELEDNRIEKDMYSSTNRINNCVIANDIRAIEAAKRQIDLIKKTGLAALSGELYLIGKLRVEFEDYTLSELAQVYQERTGINLGKMKLSYRMKKIEQILLKLSS